jgi:hypothetical protein
MDKEFEDAIKELGLSHVWAMTRKDQYPGISFTEAQTKELVEHLKDASGSLFNVFSKVRELSGLPQGQSDEFTKAIYALSFVVINMQKCLPGRINLFSAEKAPNAPDAGPEKTA